MQNPLLKSVLVNFPDVDASALPWPADADTWEAKDLELFVGSGGFIKPKKKKLAAIAVVEQPKNESTTTPGTTSGYSQSRGPQPPVPSLGVPADTELVEQPSSFEIPGFSVERHAVTMPVRVHCEDTCPHGHVRLESLTAFAERIRSLALKQIMNVSLADLQERRLAILATEFVIEILGNGIRVLDTLRIDTSPEFPSAPLFPWETTLTGEDGTLYAQGRFGLNLCGISEAGAYAGIDSERYDEFTKGMRKFADPKKKSFSSTTLRFFNAYEPSGKPFKPSVRKEAVYEVRGSDCDMYNVLFQARVPSMMESCHSRKDAMAFYVNIRTSVRPGDMLAVHVFSSDDAALFICLRGKEPVLAAFGHYGKDTVRPVCQEEIKCASMRVPLLLKFITGGAKPAACDDFDFCGI